MGLVIAGTGALVSRVAGLAGVITFTSASVDGIDKKQLEGERDR